MVSQDVWPGGLHPALCPGDLCPVLFPLTELLFPPSHGCFAASGKLWELLSCGGPQVHSEPLHCPTEAL